jgi:hypothetical protein
MKHLFACLLALFIENADAFDGEKVLAGHDSKTDLIADNYEAGRFLMYDCLEGHWVCVGDPFYQNCLAKRTQELQEKKFKASCAPLGPFPTKKSCFQRQLFMTSNFHGTQFCTLKDGKEKEISLDHY